MLEINAFWIIVSALNFVLMIAVVYAVIRVLRWVFVGRPREAAEIADLRERVAQLEATEDSSPAS